MGSFVRELSHVNMSPGGCGDKETRMLDLAATIHIPLRLASPQSLPLPG